MRMRQIIATHPDVQGNTNESLLRAIEHSYACAQACIACADACLAEEQVAELRQCIRLNLDCADICAATASMASRRTGSNESILLEMLATCATACRLCADECQQHARMHRHCALCAEACDDCEKSCNDAIQSIRSFHI